MALCEQQAEVWRAQRAADDAECPAMEREVARLEAAIAKLTDRIEDGQPLGDRLKQRQAELDALKVKLAEPPPPSVRKTLEDVVAPVGPLLGLGMGDPVETRQVLRKIGVDRIVVSPDGDGWNFKG